MFPGRKWHSDAVFEFTPGMILGAIWGRKIFFWVVGVEKFFGPKNGQNRFFDPEKPDFG